ncbi:MAG: hypothetical protein WD055_00320 [Candidatus Dependentiae bacterium]
MYKIKPIFLLTIFIITNNIACNQPISDAQKISFIEAFLNGTLKVNSLGKVSYNHYETANTCFTQTIDQLHTMFKEIQEHAAFVEDGWIPTELNEKIRAHKIKKLKDVSEFNKLEWQLERLSDFLYGEDLKHLTSEQKEQIKKHRQQLIDACKQGSVSDIKNACTHRLNPQNHRSLQDQLGALFQ